MTKPNISGQEILLSITNNVVIIWFFAVNATELIAKLSSFMDGNEAISFVLHNCDLLFPQVPSPMGISNLAVAVSLYCFAPSVYFAKCAADIYEYLKQRERSTKEIE